MFFLLKLFIMSGISPLKIDLLSKSECVGMSLYDIRQFFGIATSHAYGHRNATLFACTQYHRIPRFTTFSGQAQSAQLVRFKNIHTGLKKHKFRLKGLKYCR